MLHYVINFKLSQIILIDIQHNVRCRCALWVASLTRLSLSLASLMYNLGQNGRTASISCKSASFSSLLSIFIFSVDSALLQWICALSMQSVKSCSAYFYERYINYSIYWDSFTVLVIKSNLSHLYFSEELYSMFIRTHFRFLVYVETSYQIIHQTVRTG